MFQSRAPSTLKTRYHEIQEERHRLVEMRIRAASVFAGVLLTLSILAGIGTMFLPWWDGDTSHNLVGIEDESYWAQIGLWAFTVSRSPLSSRPPDYRQMKLLCPWGPAINVDYGPPDNTCTQLHPVRVLAILAPLCLVLALFVLLLAWRRRSMLLLLVAAAVATGGVLCGVMSVLLSMFLDNSYMWTQGRLAAIGAVFTAVVSVLSAVYCAAKVGQLWQEIHNTDAMAKEQGWDREEEVKVEEMRVSGTVSHPTLDHLQANNARSLLKVQPDSLSPTSPVSVLSEKPQLLMLPAVQVQNARSIMKIPEPMSPMSPTSQASGTPTLHQPAVDFGLDSPAARLSSVSQFTSPRDSELGTDRTPISERGSIRLDPEAQGPLASAPLEVWQRRRGETPPRGRHENFANLRRILTWKQECWGEGEVPEGFEPPPVPNWLITLAFNELDMDADHVLSVQELRDAFRVSGLEDCTESINAILRWVDKQAKGRLDILMFAEYFRTVEELTRVQNQGRRFVAFLGGCCRFCFVSNVLVLGVLAIWISRVQPTIKYASADMKQLFSLMIPAVQVLLATFIPSFLWIVGEPLVELTLRPVMGTWLSHFVITNEDLINRVKARLRGLRQWRPKCPTCPCRRTKVHPEGEEDLEAENKIKKRTSKRQGNKALRKSRLARSSSSLESYHSYDLQSLEVPDGDPGWNARSAEEAVAAAAVGDGPRSLKAKPALKRLSRSSSSIATHKSSSSDGSSTLKSQAHAHFQERSVSFNLNGEAEGEDRSRTAPSTAVLDSKEPVSRESKSPSRSPRSPHAASDKESPRSTRSPPRSPGRDGLGRSSPRPAEGHHSSVSSISGDKSNGSESSRMSKLKSWFGHGEQQDQERYDPRQFHAAASLAASQPAPTTFHPLQGQNRIARYQVPVEAPKGIPTIRVQASRTSWLEMLRELPPDDTQGGYLAT